MKPTQLFILGGGTLLLACSSPSQPAQTAGKTPAPSASVQPAPEDSRYTQLPTPSARPPFHAPVPETFELSNHLRVWHVQRPEAQLVSVHLILGKGSAADAVGKEGLTALAADLLDEGAGDLDALELSDALGALASELTIQSGVDYTMLSLSGLAENLESSLALLSAVVLEPQLKAKEFERRRDARVAAALAREASQTQMAEQSALEALFAQGYAASPTEGTASALRKLSYGEVKARAQALTVAEGTELVVVAPQTQAQLKPMLEEAFAKLKGKSTLKNRSVSEPSKSTAVRLIPFEGASQTTVGFYHRAGAANTPSYFPELLMNRALAETFTSRINLNLREDKGYTYGAYGSFRRFREAGYYYVSSNVRSDTTFETVSEVFKELQEICSTRPLTEQELADSSQGLLLGFPLRFEETFSLGMQMASIPLYGRPADFFASFESKVNAVALESARQAARPYCDPSQYYVVVAGDEKTLREELAPLGRPLELVQRSSATSKPQAP